MAARAKGIQHERKYPHQKLCSQQGIIIDLSVTIKGGLTWRLPSAAEPKHDVLPTGPVGSHTILF